MIQAYKDDKGKVKTQLDVFEYAKWGDKNDPARKNIFSNSILIDGSFYISISTKNPSDKNKDTYVSYWVPKDAQVKFAQKFDDFVVEAIKTNRATKSIPAKDRNGKDVNITFTAAIDQENNGKKFSYFKIEIVNDTKTGAITTGLGSSLNVYADDKGKGFAKELLALSERLNVIFVSKADGTVHDHYRLLATAKKEADLTNEATSPSSSDGDTDYSVFD